VIANKLPIRTEATVVTLPMRQPKAGMFSLAEQVDEAGGERREARDGGNLPKVGMYIDRLTEGHRLHYRKQCRCSDGIPTVHCRSRSVAKCKPGRDGFSQADDKPSLKVVPGVECFGEMGIQAKRRAVLRVASSRFAAWITASKV